MSELCANIQTSPVAVISEVIFYPGFSFGLRGEQRIHLHHKVAGPERKKPCINSQNSTPSENITLGGSHRSRRRFQIVKTEKIPVLLNSKLLHFAFDSLSRRLEDDALQKQEVILVKHLVPFQWTYDL